MVINMNNIDPDKYRKYLISKQSKEDNKLKKYLRGLLVRVVIVIILFLSLAIACKSNDNLKNSSIY